MGKKNRTSAIAAAVVAAAAAIASTPASTAPVVEQVEAEQPVVGETVAAPNEVAGASPELAADRPDTPPGGFPPDESMDDVPIDEEPKLVRFLTSISGHDFSYAPRDEVWLPPALADAFADGVRAELVDVDEI